MHSSQLPQPVFQHHPHAFCSPLELPVKSESWDAREPSALTMSNLTSASGEASGSSSGDGRGTTAGSGGGSTAQQQSTASAAGAAAAAGLNSNGLTVAVKRKRNLPGTPDPDAEVIALSPKTLMATNRFVCEICNKGFQRDQNLQLHRRGHNLPWKLRQRTSKEIRKRVYICPETSCVHHDPARALGDLTGIKKHFCRKHGEKKWKCEKCSKRYAVQSDWKAHSKTCGTREYRCDCGTLFSRRDSFITHRAFCDALAEENARVNSGHLPGNPGSALGMQSGGPLTMDPLSSASLRPGLSSGGSSSLGLPENSLSLLPHQMNSPASATPSSRARFSLCLGTGSGPGEAGNDYLLGGSSQGLPVGGSGSLHSMDSYRRTAMAGMLGSLDYDGQKPLSGTMSVGSGSSSHYSSLFLPGLPGAGIGQAGSMADIGAISGFSEFGALSNWQERASGERLQHSLSGGLGPNAPSALPSSSALYNHAHSSSAQMSATALLQKAAQMGATASNSSVLKSFGMAGSDSSSGALGSAWPGSRQDASRVGMPVSSVPPSHPLIRGAPGTFGHKGNSNGLGGDTRAMENANLHELLSSLPGGSAMLSGMGNLPSPLGRSFPDPRNSLLFSGNEIMNQRSSSKDNLGQHSSQFSKLPFTSSGQMFGGLGSLSKGEDGAADRQTRDFLGVRGAPNMVGAPGSMGRSLSHIGSVGMEQYSSSRDSVRSLGVSSHSPAKSWDV